MAGKVKGDTQASAAGSSAKRSYLKQADVPSTSLEEALRLPRAVFDHYAGKPTSPFNVAKALNIDPKGTQLKVLSGAAIAFGLMDGGAQAAAMGPTDLARRILRPTVEGGETAALREAVLQPRVFGDFLRRYDGSAMPRNDIAVNVLEEMGVPRDKADEVFSRLLESATSVGFIHQIKEKPYVSLDGATTNPSATHPAQSLEAPTFEPSTQRPGEGDGVVPAAPPSSFQPAVPPKAGGGSTLKAAIAEDMRRKRVFVTHGKNTAIVEPIKKLLEYGELEPVVSIERQSVSKPVPEKFMDDMRAAGAAIIHVEAEKTITDSAGNEELILNPNVLIEIGAAMAFYGRRFILLVRDGIKLPSNLQGLYEVRYSGSTLDATATIKLLEAMKDIKNYPLPGEDQ
jgi:hypothetical protein